MPVVIKRGATSGEVTSTPFINEAELQKLLADHPDLLRDASEPTIALVSREVNLSDAGSLDLLMINRDGLPIAVEVKLQRNGESRREVVAQAIDYISALSTKTIDELDETLGGNVENALRTFDDDEDVFNRRWSAAGAKLRGGLVRLVVAVDGSNPGLERILRFLAENSELDVQLVVVERFISESDEVIVARPTFSAESVSRTTASHGNRTSRVELLAVVEEYNAGALSDMKAVGVAAHYRQIRPVNWPTRFRTHYEFYQTSTFVSAELHLETDEASERLKAALESLAGKSVMSGTKQIVWDPNWSSGRGRLQIKFALPENPSDVAKGMDELISLTRTTVTEALIRTNTEASVQPIAIPPPKAVGI